MITQSPGHTKHGDSSAGLFQLQQVFIDQLKKAVTTDFMCIFLLGRSTDEKKPKKKNKTL